MIGKAFIFVGNKLYHGQRIINDIYQPILSYLEMVRDEAYSFSKKFGKDFDETTFIADGTKLKDWLSLR